MSGSETSIFSAHIYSRLLSRRGGTIRKDYELRIIGQQMALLEAVNQMEDEVILAMSMPRFMCICT